MLKEGEIPRGTVTFKDGKQFQSKITAIVIYLFGKIKQDILLMSSEKKMIKLLLFQKMIHIFHLYHIYIIRKKLVFLS